MPKKKIVRELLNLKIDIQNKQELFKIKKEESKRLHTEIYNITRSITKYQDELLKKLDKLVD